MDQSSSYPGSPLINRREFLHTSAAAIITAAASRSIAAPGTMPANPFPGNKLPRWRGFNLLEMFDANHVREFKESDFELLAEWGFNFVRLPLSYLCWSNRENWLEMREDALLNVDLAVKYGKAHGIHVNLNMHRLPGYCVNPPRERAELWTDPGALDAAARQWAGLAARYKDVPSAALSFDLINEPADLKSEVYVKVITRLVTAIREKSADRLIIADGLKWGRAPVQELVSLNIGQSTRGYMPMQVSHYQASWMVGSDKWAVPTWPLVLAKETWDKERLLHEQQPWIALQQQGVGIHVGEWGAYNRTPHPVALAWMRDNLEMWKASNWGWSVWNFSGSFGVMDSHRGDVKYENFRGHQLDRAMLELLRSL